MTMESIELQPNLFRVVLRSFFYFFILSLVTKVWAYGGFDPADTGLVLRARAIESLTATGGLFLTIILFLKHRNLILTQNSLRALMKSKRFGLWKSNTVNLSQIVVSHALIDRLCGTQVATRDEKIVHINTFFYSKKQILKFIDEIELRQSLMKNTDQSEIT